MDGQDFAEIEAYGVQRWLGELARRIAVERDEIQITLVDYEPNCRPPIAYFRFTSRSRSRGVRFCPPN